MMAISSEQIAVQIKPVTAETTLQLRQQYLRPHLSVNACKFPGDDDPMTHHLGVYDSDRIIGVISVFQEPIPDIDAQNANHWRIRGLAVDFNYRRQGYAKLLVIHIIEYVRARHGEKIWCNARPEAWSLFEHLGFEKTGEQFDIPELGLHYLMQYIF